MQKGRKWVQMCVQDKPLYLLDDFCMDRSIR